MELHIAARVVEAAEGELLVSGAVVAYVDGRAHDAAVLFGARLSQSPLALPRGFGPILEALKRQGLHDEIAAGANASADETLQRVVELAGP